MNEIYDNYRKWLNRMGALAGMSMIWLVLFVASSFFYDNPMLLYSWVFLSGSLVLTVLMAGSLLVMTRYKGKLRKQGRRKK